jgi:hypothetical protein
MPAAKRLVLHTATALSLLVVAACSERVPSIPPAVAPVFGAASEPADTKRGELFPRTPSGIALELVFNGYVPNLAAEGRDAVMVWGSSYANRPSGMYNTSYIPYALDGGTHSLAWYRANHPDWIEYRCDRKTPAYEFGATSATPLDFADPAVQAYQSTTWIDPALKSGYAGIAVDTMSLYNEWHQCGHFDAAGNWVAQFSGDGNDAAFRKAALAWEAATVAHVHAQNARATVQVNYSYEFGVSDADNLKLMTTPDMVFDERGFTNWGQGKHVALSSEWPGIVRALRRVQQQGGCYMTNGEEPGPSKDISEDERQWAIANYLLVKNDCTYMYMTGFNGHQQGYGYLVIFPEYGISIGSPQGSMFEKDGVYARTFSGGLALVNPTATTARYRLPAGSFHRTNGKPVAETVTLRASSGLVLLK